MDFEASIIEAVHSTIAGVIQEKKRHICYAAVGVPVNGKDVMVKLTFCAEPNIFSETVYANDVDRTLVTEMSAGVGTKPTTTSVIEQLKSFEALDGNDI